MCKSFCRLFNKNKECLVLLALCLSLLILFVIAFISKSGKEIENIYYVLSLIFTVGLLLVAYLNLQDINKSINTKFLYQIDQRWGDKEILKARGILHSLIVESKKESQVRSENNSYVSDILLKYYSDDAHSKEIILIINFIEFMETMGYLVYKEKTIKLKQVKNLCGYEIRMFYPIFKVLIYRLKEDYDDSDLFKNFEKLYYKCKK